MSRAVPRPARAGALAPALLAAGALAVAACQSPPVSWSEVDARRVPLPTVDASTPLGPQGPQAVADSLLRLAVAERLAPAAGSGAAHGDHGDHGTGAPAAAGHDAVAHAAMMAAAGAPADAPAAPPVALAALSADRLGEACVASRREAAGRGGERLAAWWDARPSRAAWLLAARSVDGGRTWSAPLAVDTLDRSMHGCDRPAPSVALDTVNGYAHVAYSMVAPEGEGVFYAHQMDPRAAFEVPQVVVYGDRASATSVASDGDVVVVAYEDPNTTGRPFISVALSRTGGHTWDDRLAVSGRSVAAVRPAVAVRAGATGGGGRLAVGWIERPSPRTLSTLEQLSTAVGAEPGFLVVRDGTLH